MSGISRPFCPLPHLTPWVAIASLPCKSLYMYISSIQSDPLMSTDTQGNSSQPSIWVSGHGSLPQWLPGDTVVEEGGTEVGPALSVELEHPEGIHSFPGLPGGAGGGSQVSSGGHGVGGHRAVRMCRKICCPDDPCPTPRGCRSCSGELTSLETKAKQGEGETRAQQMGQHLRDKSRGLGWVSAPRH